jgi:hypothetical protein
LFSGFPQRTAVEVVQMGDHLESLRAEARERWKARPPDQRQGELRFPRHPPDQPPPALATDSISVPRIFTPGRGSGGCVWILGRTVRTMSVAPTRVPDVTFEELLRVGYPSDVADALGAAIVEEVTAAVTRLVPLRCMCNTGAETPDQHGTIVTLAAGQNPDAPIDDRTTIGYCSVCGRGWMFNECGDSHYSYRYSVEPFDFT